MVKSKNDSLLKYFVNFVDLSDSELGINILCDGQIISATLISYKKYLTLLKEQSSSQFVETFDTVFNKLFEIANVDELNKNIENLSPELWDSMNSIIHVKDAKFILDNTSHIPSNGLLLRIKMDEISAFSFGNIIQIDNF